MAYALYMFIAFCHTLAHDLVSGNQTLLNLTLFCQNCCDVWISIKFCQHFTFNFNVRLTNLLLSSGIWANRQAQQRDSSVPPGLRIIAQALGQHRTQQLSLRQRDGWTPLDQQQGQVRNSSLARKKLFLLSWEWLRPKIWSTRRLTGMGGIWSQPSLWELNEWTREGLVKKISSVDVIAISEIWKHYPLTHSPTGAGAIASKNQVCR